MDWKEAKKQGANTFELPGDWLLIEYFDALNTLFRFENALRVFVYIILKNEFKEKWMALSILSDDEESSTINAIFKKRVSQDKNYAYIGYNLNAPLLYLTSGELIRIITSDSYWKLFKPYFLGTKEIMKNKLDEIGNVRNSVAHFRPIRKGDVELIKLNSIHTLSEIENTITDFITCRDVVPTNSEDLWYKELTSLKAENCELNITQSKKEYWIKLNITLNIPLTNLREFWPKQYMGTVFNLKTNSLLKLYPNLAKHSICVTESFSPTMLKRIEPFEFKKTIHITFSKKSIIDNHSIIKEEIENIFMQISSELKLIMEDNLARGKLIESINIELVKTQNSSYYRVDKEKFRTPVKEESPVEFWGSLNNVSANFISSTEIFPWMPINISEDDLPF